MKTRILFLDDEPLALQGLQRMLRNMRESWEMVFVDSGARALELMDQSSFDLVVTDMLMPGMNGAQFLNEVRRRHPQTVRLVLSGHADKDLILQCAGSAHQCVAKPCQPEKLKAVLTRVTRLFETALGHGKVAQSLTQIDRVPSRPSLYIEIVESLLNADASLDDVASIAIQDPGITAMALKWGNSPFFGTARELPDAAQSIACLGLDTFRALVFNVNAFAQFESAKFHELEIDAWSKQSLGVALAATRIAEAEQADEKTCQAAYAAGLLHDIGGLVMARHFPEEYVAAINLARETGTKLEAAESKVLGVSHAAAGAYLLGLWGLPPAVVDAVAWHSDPTPSASREFSPITAVHVAAALISDRHGFRGGIPALEIDSSYLSLLGLEDRLSAWQLAVSGDAMPSLVHERSIG